jgi:hypothetical protein
LDASGKAYAVINGKLDDDVELGEPPKTQKLAPVTLDGETSVPVPERNKGEPVNVSIEMFRELLKLWEPLF